MLAVGNEELTVHITAGDEVPCPHCHKPHVVRSDDGKEPGTDRVTAPNLLQTVKCPESGKAYVVGIAGKYLPPKPQASKYHGTDGGFPSEEWGRLNQSMWEDGDE